VGLRAQHQREPARGFLYAYGETLLSNRFGFFQSTTVATALTVWRGTHDSNHKVLLDSSLPPNDAWFHLGMTVDVVAGAGNSTATLYVNGASVGSGAFVADTTVTAAVGAGQYFSVGGNGSVYTNQNGYRFAHAKFWHGETLSAGEVLADYIE